MGRRPLDILSNPRRSLLGRCRSNRRHSRQCLGCLVRKVAKSGRDVRPRASEQCRAILTDHAILGRENHRSSLRKRRIVLCLSRRNVGRSLGNDLIRRGCRPGRGLVGRGRSLGLDLIRHECSLSQTLSLWTQPPSTQPRPWRCLPLASEGWGAPSSTRLRFLFASSTSCPKYRRRADARWASEGDCWVDL